MDILGFLKLIIIANDQPSLPENFVLEYQIRQVVFVLGEQYLLIKISLMFTLRKNTCSKSTIFEGNDDSSFLTRHKDILWEAHLDANSNWISLAPLWNSTIIYPNFAEAGLKRSCTYQANLKNFVIQNMYHNTSNLGTAVAKKIRSPIT